MQQPEITIIPVKEIHPLSKDLIESTHKKVLKLRLEDKHTEALSLLKPLIETYPSEAAFAVMLADVYKGLSRDVDAINVLKGVLDLKPNHVHALTVLGDICKFNEKYNLASELLKQAYDYDSEDVYALIIRGDICTRTQQFDEALFFLGRALTLDKTNPLTRYLLAYHYWERINKDNQDQEKMTFYKKKMLEHLNAAIEMIPHYKNALTLRGDIFPTAYFEDFDTLLKLNPKNLQALKLKGKHLLKTRAQYDLAIHAFTDGLQLDTTNIEFLIYRATAYKKRAERNFLISNNLDPYTFISESEGLYIKFGSCQDDLNKALADLKLVFNAKEKHLIQIDIDKLLGNLDRARENLEIFLERFPHDPMALLIKGELELNNAYPNALECFKQAINISLKHDIKDVDFLMNLANACIILANANEENRDFEKYMVQSFKFYQMVSERAPHLLSLKIKTSLTLLNSNIINKTQLFDDYQWIFDDSHIYETVLDSWKNKVAPKEPTNTEESTTTEESIDMDMEEASFILKKN